MVAFIGDDRIETRESSRATPDEPGSGPRTQTRPELELRGQVAAATRARPRIALAHDWLVGVRGGERVLDAIARLCEGRFEIAGLYTMFDDGRPLSPAIDKQTKFVSHLNCFPAKLRRWLLPRYPTAVEDLSRQLAFDHARTPIDLLISTSSSAIKGLRPPEGVPHLCYCHAPARYLWSQTEQYTQGGLVGRLRALGFRLYGDTLRDWDRRTASNVTTFLANSTHTQREIARCYTRESVVVYPPVRTDFFTPCASTIVRSERSTFWLYVGALESYKRVDLAIHAACLAGEHLDIVGVGSHETFLRRLAEQTPKKNTRIRFLGATSDSELRDHYRDASVLVFPQLEDFGIVAVEAQACGTPVVAFRAGGALDSVIENQTGVFFDDPTPEAIVAAVQRCLALGDTTAACRASAERFSEARFEQAMLDAIEQTLSKA